MHDSTSNTFTPYIIKGTREVEERLQKAVYQSRLLMVFFQCILMKAGTGKGTRRSSCSECGRSIKYVCAFVNQTNKG